MSNQVFLWATFFVPWLTIFFMKREDIKRFLPVAIMSALLSVIIYEAGITFGWWVIWQTAYPLQLLPYLIGLHPALVMWLWKFFYKKFWLFVAVDAVANLGFVFVFIGYFINGRGIAHVNNNWLLFGIVTALGLFLYAYQNWQEGIFKHPYREADDKTK